MRISKASSYVCSWNKGFCNDGSRKVHQMRFWHNLPLNQTCPTTIMSDWYIWNTLPYPRKQVHCPYLPVKYCSSWHYIRIDECCWGPPLTHGQIWIFSFTKSKKNTELMEESSLHFHGHSSVQHKHWDHSDDCGSHTLTEEKNSSIWS